MPTITEVRAEFRRTVSDGSYGNETYSLSFVASVDPAAGDDAMAIARDLAWSAHSLVVDRLRASENRTIRRAFMTPAEIETDELAEREEWKAASAERERIRQEYLAAQAARTPTAEDDAEDDEGDGEQIGRDKTPF